MDDNNGRSVGEPTDDSPVSSENTEDSDQGNAATLGIHAMPSVGSGTFENLESPSGMSSRSSAPPSGSSSQDLKIDQPDETVPSSSADVSTGASGVREDPNFPCVVPGEQTSSGAAAGDGAIGSVSSDRIQEESFCPVSALYHAYKEIVILRQFRFPYCDDFDAYFESPSAEKKKDLYDNLRSFLEREQIIYQKRTPPSKWHYEHFVKDALYTLEQVVLQSLISTLSVQSSLTVHSISLSYRNFTTLYTNFERDSKIVIDYHLEKVTDREYEEEIRKSYIEDPKSVLLLTKKALEDVLNHIKSVGYDSSPGVSETRGKSDEEISKYASNARKLLVTLLKEMDNGLISPNCRSELIFFESESFHYEIMSYLRQRRTKFIKRFGEDRQMTLEYRTAESYETFVRIVVQSLVSTESFELSRKVGTLMLNYRNLKKFYERFSEQWREGYPQDKDSRSIVKELKNTAKYLLQARNAFREFLLHMGEWNLKEDAKKRFENMLFPEDIRFFRRRIF